MKTLTCTNGQEFQVDDADYEWASSKSWHANPANKGNGTYVSTSIKDGTGKWRTKYIHRLLMGEPRGQTVDHIDLNPLNNRRSNLRIATQSQNNANMGTPKHNTSGFKGVSFHKNRGNWEAYITTNRKRICLGRHASAEEAARAYDEKAREIHGEFARCNFPA